jgi:nucleotide-binding universal stress UspA family protein
MEPPEYLQRTINRIMVLLSEERELWPASLKHAAGLAGLFKASVVLAYPIAAPRATPSVMPMTSSPVMLLTTVWEKAMKDAEANLANAKAMMADLGITADTKVLDITMSTGKSICEAARGACDMIVVTEEKVGGLKGLLHRSLAVDIVKNAWCPVVVIETAENETPEQIQGQVR